MRFKLQAFENNRTYTSEFDAISLVNILEEIKQWLQGCGFILGIGYLDIVNDEDFTKENDDTPF